MILLAKGTTCTKGLHTGRGTNKRTELTMSLIKKAEGKSNQAIENQANYASYVPTIENFIPAD